MSAFTIASTTACAMPKLVTVAPVTASTFIDWFSTINLGIRVIGDSPPIVITSPNLSFNSPPIPGVSL